MADSNIPTNRRSVQKPVGRHSAQRPAPTPAPRKRPVIETEAKKAPDALLLSALLILSMAASAGLLQNGIVQLMPSAGQSGIRTILSIIIYGILLLALSFVAYRHHKTFVARYRLKAEKTAARAAAISALLVLSALIILRLFSILWTLITGQMGWAPPQADGLVQVFGNSNTGFFLATLSVVVVAPFVEELVFRGVFQEWMKERMAPWIAILITSVLFACYHLSFWAFVLNLLLGLTTGWLAEKRSTLWPAISLHALYNATLVAAAFYIAKG